jgi:hypothetical protein
VFTPQLDLEVILCSSTSSTTWFDLWKTKLTSNGTKSNDKENHFKSLNNLHKFRCTSWPGRVPLLPRSRATPSSPRATPHAPANAWALLIMRPSLRARLALATHSPSSYRTSAQGLGIAPVARPSEVLPSCYREPAWALLPCARLAISQCRWPD